jgi:hypothetical protein
MQEVLLLRIVELFSFAVIVQCALIQMYFTVIGNKSYLYCCVRMLKVPKTSVK